MRKRMSLIYQRHIIKDVPARWREQYAGDMRLPLWNGETPGDVAKRLSALDLNTCSSGDIDKAIGTTGWADNECDICKKSHPTVLHLGDEVDYDARWVRMCLGCLKRAEKTLSTAKAKP